MFHKAHTSLCQCHQQYYGMTTWQNATWQSSASSSKSTTSTSAETPTLTSTRMYSVKTFRSPTVLAQASAADQKQMLGERLFPLIQQTHPDLAGKITGMMLEMDNAQIIHLLEFREALAAKVDEAVSVLYAHQARESKKR